MAHSHSAAARLLNSPSSPCCGSQLSSHIRPQSATSRLLPSINLLCYLRFQLFDPKQRIDGKYESSSPLMPALRLSGGRAVSTSGFLPTRREHSSHLSARISGLVTSRANLLQRSVTLNPPVVLSACPWMSAGIGSILGTADHSNHGGKHVNERRQRLLSWQTADRTVALCSLHRLEPFSLAWAGCTENKHMRTPCESLADITPFEAAFARTLGCRSGREMNAIKKVLCLESHQHRARRTREKQWRGLSEIIYHLGQRSENEVLTLMRNHFPVRWWKWSPTV